MIDGKELAEIYQRYMAREVAASGLLNLVASPAAPKPPAKAPLTRYAEVSPDDLELSMHYLRQAAATAVSRH